MGRQPAHGGAWVWVPKFSVERTSWMGQAGQFFWLTYIQGDKSWQILYEVCDFCWPHRLKRILLNVWHAYRQSFQGSTSGLSITWVWKGCHRIIELNAHFYSSPHTLFTGYFVDIISFRSIQKASSKIIRVKHDLNMFQVRFLYATVAYRLSAWWLARQLPCASFLRIPRSWKGSYPG